MKRYIEHIKDTHTTHERRQKAMRIAGGLTAMLFAVWLGTLGVRLTSQFGPTADATDTQTQVASVVSAVESSGAQLQVSTTTVFQ